MRERWHGFLWRLRLACLFWNYSPLTTRQILCYVREPVFGDYMRAGYDPRGAMLAAMCSWEWED